MNALVLVGAALVALAAALGIFFLPKLELRRLGPALEPDKRLELENELRRTVGQFIGSVVLLCGVFFSYQQFLATQRTLQISENATLAKLLAEAAVGLTRSGFKTW